jgi:hypothetical protein
MSTGLFQRLFAAAEGSLGAARVQPQVTRAWAPEAPSIEASAAEAPVAAGLAIRAEAAEPTGTMAAPSIRPRPGPASAPRRVQSLEASVQAVETEQQQAAAAAHPEHAATPPRSAPAIARARASLQAQVMASTTKPPLLHLPSPPPAQASEADERTDAPPALLQPSRPTGAPTAPPVHPATVPSRLRPAPAAATAAAEPTVVHVSIGRVEFLPAAPAPPSRPRAAPRAAPHVPLADYLSGKSR